jgi:phage baseplate assembly protein gpV
MTNDDIVNLIKKEVSRALSHRTHLRIGTVSGYDPKTNAVKVIYQPDGSESGWAPHSRHAAGKVVSHVHGPTPGTKENPGDQAVVGFFDGDMENPVILGYMHSDKDPPPEVKSGETMIRHTPPKDKSKGSGQQQQEHKPFSIFIDAKGKLTITGNDQGMSHATQDNGPIALKTPDKGTITIDAAKGSVAVSGDKEVSVKTKKKLDIDAGKGQVSVKGKPVTVDDLSGKGTVTPDVDA